MNELEARVAGYRASLTAPEGDTLGDNDIAAAFYAWRTGAGVAYRSELEEAFEQGWFDAIRQPRYLTVQEVMDYASQRGYSVGHQYIIDEIRWYIQGKATDARPGLPAIKHGKQYEVSHLDVDRWLSHPGRGSKKRIPCPECGGTNTAKWNDAMVYMCDDCEHAWTPEGDS